MKRKSSGCLLELITAFNADRGCLDRQFLIHFAPQRTARYRQFFTEYQARLEELEFADLTHSDQVDYLLLRDLLAEQMRYVNQVDARFAATETLVPFALDLIALEESRRNHEIIVPAKAAGQLDAVAKKIAALHSALGSAPRTESHFTAGYAAQVCQQLHSTLKTWFDFYHTYDPLFDWWVTKPYNALTSVLKDYATFLRETVAGVVGDTILGEPIGRDALVSELRHAQIYYSPEELIAAAQKELEWVRSEMRSAANELGHGDDWRAALDQVKSEHAEPGQQPTLVRDLVWEAIHYVEEHDLVTVPPMARECWRMSMMSAEAQKVNPFFLGGEQIIVSFPTSDMDHERKMMSLRGNNPAFARATVHHEIIPGHHLQMFSMARHKPHRQMFWTAFWIEGWALHWEMLLWERQFARTPQERMGMLFWRYHRGARVVFSLKFHMGQMTAEECVEMLVNEAGHERANAQAEVRRSFEGNYGALYQCAYLVGAWQMHALYRELVGAGQMTDRDFHDAVLKENCIPIPTLRAILKKEPLDDAFSSSWRFLSIAGPEVDSKL